VTNIKGQFGNEVGRKMCNIGWEILE